MHDVLHADRGLILSAQNRCFYGGLSMPPPRHLSSPGAVEAGHGQLLACIVRLFRLPAFSELPFVLKYLEALVANALGVGYDARTALAGPLLVLGVAHRE